MKSSLFSSPLDLTNVCSNTANSLLSKPFIRVGLLRKMKSVEGSHCNGKTTVVSCHLMPGHLEGSFMGKKRLEESRGGSRGIKGSSRSPLPEKTPLYTGSALFSLPLLEISAPPYIPIAPHPGPAQIFSDAIIPVCCSYSGWPDCRSPFPKFLDPPLEESSRKVDYVRTLLIDNYDSYTYNIYQELSVVNGVPPVVVKNNEWTWEELLHCLYHEKLFDNIVISAGPGSLTCAADVGICLRLLLECRDIPILGVCLGHQALGYVHGAQIVHASEPVHGRMSEIEHNGCRLFHNIPSGTKSGFKVVRYHSLVIDANSLPEELLPIAWTTSAGLQSFVEFRKLDIVPDACDRQIRSSITFDGPSCSFSHTDKLHREKVLMGIKHSTRPHYGLQFHPESIATCHGRQIFQNFREVTMAYWKRSKQKFNACMQVPGVSQVFGIPQSEMSRCNEDMLSYRGNLLEDMDDKNGFQMFHFPGSSVDKKHLRLKWKRLHQLAARVGGARNIFCELFGANGAEDTFWLDSSSVQKELLSFSYDEKDFEGLPFDFYGGYIGYIGYGLKVECGMSSNRHKSTAPDACFFFTDRFVVIYHRHDDVYIMAVQEGNTTLSPWLDDVEHKLLQLEAPNTRMLNHQISLHSSSLQHNSRFQAVTPRDQYIENVHKCLEYIRDGESYDLCLTTQIRNQVKGLDSLGLYLHLRERNPAPYAAWLNFASDKLCICSSSPERFLRLDRNGVLEAKPIKGTIARGSTEEEDELNKLQLQYSENDQAENLMIVDLLRNDLGRVCEPGSVHVPRLMEVESYVTVHTMVSTIRGKKRSNMTAVDCVRAAFPGCSMTGAPKLRSMEILDSLESCARGVYSGSIGFFSYKKTFDLNIVIRTVVVHGDEASISAGGAILGLSNAEDEYDEMLLKTHAPAQAVVEFQ